MIESRIRKVTLFEDRAEVVRDAKAHAPVGGAWLAFGGMSPYLDDRSVQVRVVKGGGRVLGARVKRKVHHDQAIGRDELEALEEVARACARRIRDADSAAARAHACAEHGRTLGERWAAGLVLVPNGFVGERADAWRAAHEQLVRAEAEALTTISQAKSSRLRAEDDWKRAQARLREGHAALVRHEAIVEVHLEGDAEEASLEISYRTAGALWRPEHTARVVREKDSKSRIEIVTWGAVWQRTGEAWNDVELHLSTARPAQNATAPLVTEDLVVSRRRTDDERHRTVIEARDQTIFHAGLEGERAVEEMPGVDDGGVPLTFQTKSTVRIASDGRPARVEIARVTLDAKIAIVAFPELAAIAHVRATATLGGGSPLLAGPVHVTIDGVVAGRARLRFVGSGEPFELGFGTEDAVRVRRTVENVDDTTAIVGTQKRKRTVTVWLSNLSREPKRVKVVERIPVSEIAGLEVVWLGHKEWTLDERDGLAEREVELAGRATEKLVLSYEVRAASKMVLPELS